MRLAAFALAAALVVGCAADRVQTDPPKLEAAGLVLQDVPVQAAEPAPIEPPRVRFAITYIRDWRSPFYSTGGLVVSLTMAECRAYGIPDELWIFAATYGRPDIPFEIYLVKPAKI